MKRILLIIASFLMIISCGAKNESEIPTLKIVSIGGSQPKNYETWVNKVNEYIEPKIGAKIEMEIIPWGDWDSRRSVITASRSDYDIIFGDLKVYTQDVKNGNAMPLDEFLKKYDYKKLMDVIPKDYWKGVKIDNQIYAIPTYKDSSATQYFVLDKKYVDKYNLDTTKIKDFEDLTEFLRKIKNETNKPSVYLTQGGVWQLFKDYDQLGLGMPVIGVRFDDENYKVVNILEEEKIQKDLELIHSWYNEGIINSDAATSNETVQNRPFFIAQGWPSAGKTVWGPQNGTEVVVIQFGETIISNGTVQGSLNEISSNSKYPEKALQFLQLLNTDPVLRDIFAYGEIGVNFDYVDVNGEKRIDRDEMKYENWPVPAYTQAQFFIMSLPKELEINQWDEVKKLNEQAKPSVLLGFNLDTSEIQDEIANVNAIYYKYDKELTTGTKEPKQLIKMMVEEMKKVGLDDIQKEAQRQIDEFKMNK